MKHALYELLQSLDHAKMHYTISRHREESILVSITLVGERIEIDVFEDSHMEVCRFIGNENVIGDELMVNRLLDKWKNDD